MAYRIDMAEPLADGLGRIAVEQLEAAIRNLRLPEDQRTVGVHRCRKSVKKTRALLRLVRAEIGEDLYRSENATLRDIAAGLSAMRDADVMVETLTALREWAGERLQVSDIAALRRTLLEAQAALAGTPTDGGAAQHAIDGLESALERARLWPIERNRFIVVEGGIKRTYRSGRKGYARALEDPTGDAMHEWRKQVKYLWYMTRILAGAVGDAGARLVEDLDRLAALLGDGRDLALLRAAALATEGIFEDARIVETIDIRRAELQEEAMSLGSRLYNPKPKSFTRMIRDGWNAWRNSLPPGLQESNG